MFPQTYSFTAPAEILLMMYLEKKQNTTRMGITEIVPPLQAINAFAMVLGAFFTWLLAKDSFDIRAANRVLLLLVLNPLF